MYGPETLGSTAVTEAGGIGAPVSVRFLKGQGLSNDPVKELPAASLATILDISSILDTKGAASSDGLVWLR